MTRGFFKVLNYKKTDSGLQAVVQYDGRLSFRKLDNRFKKVFQDKAKLYYHYNLSYYFERDRDKDKSEYIQDFGTIYTSVVNYYIK
jgi:hypothetical protein